MKISESVAPSVTSRSNHALRASRSSFSELLASGRTAQSIRSERAFGFSETGIFGAPRPVGGERDAPKSPLLPQREFDGAARHGAAKKHQSISAYQFDTPAKAVGVHSKQIFYGAVLKSGFNWATLKLSVSSYQPATYPRMLYSQLHAEHASVGKLVTPIYDASNRRTKLSISGQDTEISVFVNEAIDGESDMAALFSTFFTVAQQFGMTLSSVRLSYSSKGKLTRFDVE